MKKIKVLISLALLLAYCFSAIAQRVDKVIDMGIYKSYFCFSLKDPLYVTYTLIRGGGSCDRSHFHFTSCGVQTAAPSDYSHSHYDEGHLANAEDFASDCTLEKKTFCFYNCLPQTVRLNRGIWKTYETKIRALSQTQALFIICGGIYSNKTLKPRSTVGVPDYCYKIVMNPRTKQIIFCLLFPNDSSDSVQSITLADLKNRLGYPLMP